MAICSSTSGTKYCDLKAEDCTECMPGPYMNTPYWNLYELFDSAARQNDQLEELVEVIGELCSLKRCSKLGESNKEIFSDLISRLYDVVSAMSWDCTIMRTNLAYQCELSDQTVSEEQ